jgi:hypothetical protein
MALFQEFAGSLSQFMEPAMNTFATGLLTRIADDYSLDLTEITARYLSKSGDAKWAPHTVKIIDLNTHANATSSDDEGGGAKGTGATKATRAPRRKKSVEGSDKPMCEGLTAKGTPCKNKAKPEECLCHIHLRKKEKDESGESSAPKKSRKAKKVDPVHTHLPLEEPEAEVGCGVCDSHGDVSVAECDEPTFDVDSDIQSRLAAILACEDESDDEDDDDEDDEDDEEETATVTSVVAHLVASAEEEEEEEEEIE